jgi:ATP/ADP translocase
MHDGLLVFLNAIAWINYGITLVFIYLFYRNYANISATSSTKKLMKDILKTRKTVKYYVWYNLGMIAFQLVSGLVLGFRYSKEGTALFEKMQHEDKTMVLIICILFLIVVAAIAICWFIYRLLYGILLRKLLANYKILKQINLE